MFASVYIDTQSVDSKFAKTIVENSLKDFQKFNVQAFIHVDDLNTKDYETTPWVVECDNQGIDIKMVSTRKTNVAFQMMTSMFKQELQSPTNTVVIVSNSSCFEPLIKELQRLGKNVYAMCNESTLKESFIYYYDNFYNLTYFYNQNKSTGQSKVKGEKLNTHVKFSSKPKVKSVTLKDVDRFMRKNRRKPSKKSNSKKEKKLAKFLNKFEKTCLKSTSDDTTSIRKKYKDLVDKYPTFFNINTNLDTKHTKSRPLTPRPVFPLPKNPPSTPVKRNVISSNQKFTFENGKRLSFLGGDYYIHFFDGDKAFHLSKVPDGYVSRLVLTSSESKTKGLRCTFNLMLDGSYVIQVGNDTYLTKSNFAGRIVESVKNKDFVNQKFNVEYNSDNSTYQLSMFKSKLPISVTKDPFSVDKHKQFMLKCEKTTNPLSSLFHDNMYMSNQTLEKFKTFSLVPCEPKGSWVNTYDVGTSKKSVNLKSDLKNLQKVDSFLKTFGRRPSSLSIDTKEKKLGKFLSVCRKNYNSKLSLCRKGMKNIVLKKAYESLLKKHSKQFGTALWKSSKKKTSSDDEWETFLVWNKDSDYGTSDYDWSTELK